MAPRNWSSSIRDLPQEIQFEIYRLAFSNLPWYIQFEIYRRALTTPGEVRNTHNDYLALNLPIATQIHYVYRAIIEEVLRILHGGR
jgi:hypothetical protein